MSKIKLLKSLIYRSIYLPIKFNGKSENFEKIFKHNYDPWNFENSDWEKKRFDILLDFINEINPDRVLEIGCADGVFTKRLSNICRDVLAIEVSKTALEIAKKRVPEVKFLLGDFTKIVSDLKNENFDMVIMSEVLYYVKEQDIKVSLNSLNSRYLLTSNFLTVSNKLDKLIEESGYRELKSKWLSGIDDFQIKVSKICLWEKNIKTIAL